MSGSTPLLVLAAWTPELRALGRMSGVATHAVGVGLVEAALGATRAVADIAPRAVILIGTAGRYARSTARIGDVVVARRISLHERPRAYYPAPMPTTVETSAKVRRTLALPAQDVVCPLDVSTALVDTDGVENLEAFAVARACGRIPFVAVLGISNTVGPNAHAEWRKHGAEAAAAACAAVRAWLTARPARASSARG